MDQQHRTTCLFGTQRVRKDHPRIALRGALDEAYAQAVIAQLAARKEGENGADKALFDVLAAIRRLMACEYDGTPLDLETHSPIDWERAHAQSHQPLRCFGTPHFYVTADMGETMAQLNLLRTQVRGCERLAAGIEELNEDLVVALNRLSSYVYCLMCALPVEKEGCAWR